MESKSQSDQSLVYCTCMISNKHIYSKIDKIKCSKILDGNVRGLSYLQMNIQRILAAKNINYFSKY